MPLSIAKLQTLLTEKGFMPVRYFVMNGACFYIELYSQHSADTFFLYIPSKYNFTLDSGQGPGTNVFKIKYIDMSATNNTAEEYTGGEKPDVEKTYANANIELSPDKGKLEEHLESNYRQQIALQDISEEDTAELRTIYRQMRRLRYCVQNLKYKLGIVYKNYICAIRRDDSIDCFFVKHLPRAETKKLLIIVDLETFYEKAEKLTDDIRTVRESIYRILERNQGMHTRVIHKMIQNRKDIAVIPKSTEQKKLVYDSLLQEYEKLLQMMIREGKKVSDEIRALDKQEGQHNGLQSDISRAHTRSRLEKEYTKISAIKSEIGHNIAVLRNKRENSLIAIDNLMFDNTIMWDCMLRNFAQMKDFC